MDKITTAIVDEVYPIIENSLSKYKSRYKACVGRFISKHSEDLYDTGPNNRILFGKDDTMDFYNSIGIKEGDIINCLSHTYYWDIPFSPIAAKDPFTICMMMVIRYFYIHKMSKELELSAIYLAFSGKFYASVHYNSFPKFIPSSHRAVMDYTINYVLTQKYDIKREGSVFGAVRSLSKTWLESYEDKFKNPDDSDVAYLIDQLRNRLKSFMINIATAYYNTYENKDYLNYESDNNDEDNYRIADNDALLAARYTENTINYMSNSDVDYRFCMMCKDQNVKADEIRDIMTSIKGDPQYQSEMKDVINILITDYMRTFPTTKNLQSINFISYSIKAKPNTKDKDLLKLKSTIEMWLDESSPNYRRRKSREATKNSYYKSVLKYIVLMINKSNK